VNHTQNPDPSEEILVLGNSLTHLPSAPITSSLLWNLDMLTNNKSTKNINDCCQVNESVLPFNVSKVTNPYLVRFIDN